MVLAIEKFVANIELVLQQTVPAYLLLELVPVPGHGAQICARADKQKVMITLAAGHRHRSGTGTSFNDCSLDFSIAFNL